MKLLPVFLFTVFCFSAAANDSISIKINKLHFMAGDTMTFSCNIANFQTLGLESATMNVWIEDLNKTQTWKFRYPMQNGSLPKTKLVISDSLRPGTYAINFVIQKGLFSLYGKVTDNKHSSINYFIVTRDEQLHSSTVSLTPQGEFGLRNIVFDNEATIVFSPLKAKQDNDLRIDVITPLDSAFKPEAVLTQMIRVGNTEMADTAIAYEFIWDAAQVKDMLPHVTVTAKQTKRVAQFNEQYASAFFRQDDNNARWLDGLEDPALSKSADLTNFLYSRVPGFSKVIDVQSNQIKYYLRGEGAIVYLNEMPLQNDFDINFLNPSEIAMIKVVNGPTMINRMGNGGAIMIYTKRGNYYNDPKSKRNFILSGYTPQLSTWK